jgi:hypothetical protein
MKILETGDTLRISLKREICDIIPIFESITTFLRLPKPLINWSTSGFKTDKSLWRIADICNQVINASTTRYSVRDIFPIRAKPVPFHISLPTHEHRIL